MKYLNYGKCTMVFKDEKEIFKKYFSKTLCCNQLSLEMFKLLKGVHNIQHTTLFYLL